MLDIKFIRNNMDFVRQKMTERRAAVDLDRFSELDARRRDILQEVENLRNERNTVSKEIGTRKKNKEDSTALMSAMAEVSARIKELDDSLKNVEAELSDFVLTIPNIAEASVVCGGSAEDNPVVRTWGDKPAFDFVPRPHWEISESLGILDFAL